jgi:hypothetical protein
MPTDNFCFYLQNTLLQTSQTGGQRSSDTSPFSIPWPVLSCSFRCDQIGNNQCYEFGHTVVLLKSDLDVQQTYHTVVLLKSDLDVQQTYHTVVLLQSDLDVQQTYHRGGLVGPLSP